MAQSELTEYIRHTAIEGERWDTLAWTYYADASRYGEILRANPGLRNEQGQWPDLPEAGTQLLIPVIAMTDKLPLEALPPWIR